MKKIALYILILVALTGIFGSALNVQALDVPNEPTGSSAEYKFLAPLPNSSETFDTQDKGALGKYLNLIINLVIGISAVLAVVMIVMGGIEYMGSELISSKEAGKERIQNAILGLLIALGAYALLNTINPDLLNSDINIPDAKVTVEINDNVPQTYDPTTKKYKNGQVYGTPLTGTPTPLPTGVALNNGWSQCTYVGQTTCTSTIGLNMDGVWAVRNGCNCNLTITGGTEWWAHGASGSTTHQVGNGTVDLRTDTNPNNPLNKYFSGGKPLEHKKWYKSPAGYAYYETNHWHFNPSGQH